jgi:hypothetical protein
MDDKSEGLRFIHELDKKGKFEVDESKFERTENEVMVLLDEMLRFLGEIPVDEDHDYRIFRHGGLRSYLINRFLREKKDNEFFSNWHAR